MRLREFFSTTITALALTTVSFGSPTVINADLESRLRDEAVIGKTISGPVALTPAPLISRDKILGSAYYDTLSILSSPNQCSDFFGGPSAVNIFNQLISKVRKGHFPTSIGMQMSGTTTNVFDADSKKQYRLFDKIFINTNGPFYRKKRSNYEPSIPLVGNFQPNTNEARVLILLHELGHAVKGPQGGWLIPDDGNDLELSRKNTQRIERVCRDQIKAGQERSQRRSREGTMKSISDNVTRRYQGATD